MPEGSQTFQWGEPIAWETEKPGNFTSHISKREDHGPARRVRFYLQPLSLYPTLIIILVDMQRSMSDDPDLRSPPSSGNQVHLSTLRFHEEYNVRKLMRVAQMRSRWEL
ncbi:hypothetical protein WG66_016173 [Moniliophthora roreri]|nr:hypothetical protein WG66_016173 [Moniliophthora roreri]